MSLRLHDIFYPAIAAGVDSDPFGPKGRLIEAKEALHSGFRCPVLVAGWMNEAFRSAFRCSLLDPPFRW